MRPLVLLCALLLVVGSLSAQVRIVEETIDPSAEVSLSHGEFSVLLMEAFDTIDVERSSEDALLELQRLGLVPQTWIADGTLTHGELAQVVSRFGGSYNPAEPESPASRAFTESFLRRQLSALRDFVPSMVTHEDASAYAMDFGIDTGVSPSNF